MLVDCVEVDELSSCVETCLSEYDHFSSPSYGGDCIASMAGFHACWGGMTCEDLRVFYAREGSFLCDAEEARMAEACYVDVDQALRDSCRSGCAKSGECYSSARRIGYNGCLNGCVLHVSSSSDDGEECMAALLEARACGHGLNCAGYTSWLGGETDNPCGAEDEAVREACPSQSQ